MAVAVEQVDKLLAHLAVAVEAVAVAQVSLSVYMLFKQLQFQSQSVRLELLAQLAESVAQEVHLLSPLPLQR